MKVFTSASNRRRALAAALAIALAVVGVYLALREFAPFVFDPTAMRQWIQQFGAFAPLVFVLVQLIQVIVAPVPGQVTAFVGGVLFGPVAGTAYSMIGVMIGSAIAFWIAQRWGRPAVERMIEPGLVDRFDGFVQTIGVPGLLLFVVVPGLPDDAICFFAGLAHFRILTFLVVMFVGRLPAYLVTNFAGDSVAGGQFVEAAALIGALVVFSVYAYRKRERIRELASDV
jgi:uncharacterized membrane protein YdjX (TVP38/TMEM64 family)